MWVNLDSYLAITVCACATCIAHLYMAERKPIFLMANVELECHQELTVYSSRNVAKRNIYIYIYIYI
jgi:hypothetical protein